MFLLDRDGDTGVISGPSTATSENLEYSSTPDLEFLDRGYALAKVIYSL
jgi:hypothetical protein